MMSDELNDQNIDWLEAEGAKALLLFGRLSETEADQEGQYEFTFLAAGPNKDRDIQGTIQVKKEWVEDL